MPVQANLCAKELVIQRKRMPAFRSQGYLDKVSWTHSLGTQLPGITLSFNQASLSCESSHGRGGLHSSLCTLLPLTLMTQRKDKWCMWKGWQQDTLPSQITIAQHLQPLEVMFILRVALRHHTSPCIFALPGVLSQFVGSESVHKKAGLLPGP